MRDRIELLFPLVGCLFIPFVVNLVFRGSYVLPAANGGRYIWVGPIGSTLPFVALAVIFAVHVCSSRSIPPFPAYLGGLMAWMGLAGYTVHVISQPSGPSSSSTMAVAVLISPFLYLPYLVVPYAIGAMIGSGIRCAPRPSSPDAADTNPATQAPPPDQTGSS